MFWSMRLWSSLLDERVSFFTAKWKLLNSGFFPKSRLSTNIGTRVMALLRVVSPYSLSITEPTVMRVEE